MSLPERAPEYVEIFLQPGGFYFGDSETRIRTLLGSCVAMTMWHPQRRIGAMCHYLLPTRDSRRPVRRAPVLDGRYGDEAYLLFLSEAIRHDSDPGEYEIKIFGGGNMFPGLRNGRRLPIGEQNVAAGLRLLALHGHPVRAHSVGGHGYRSLVFDLWSGETWLKRGGAAPPAPMRNRAS
jgi:chemotaxis protein CheD